MELIRQYAECTIAIDDMKIFEKYKCWGEDKKVRANSSFRCIIYLRKNTEVGCPHCGHPTKNTRLQKIS